MTSNYLHKMKKELKTQIYAVRIYSQDIGREFGIEKCIMKVMKSGKRPLIDKMELENQPQRSEKRKPTNTRASRRLTLTKMWR